MITKRRSRLTPDRTLAPLGLSRRLTSRNRRSAVSGGNSGADIACDAARNADAAFFSVRRGYRLIPKHVFGVPMDVFINDGGKPPAGVVVPEYPSELIDAMWVTAGNVRRNSE